MKQKLPDRWWPDSQLQLRYVATGCHFTGPIALRRRISPGLPTLKLFCRCCSILYCEQRFHNRNECASGSRCHCLEERFEFFSFPVSNVCVRCILQEVINAYIQLLTQHCKKINGSRRYGLGELDLYSAKRFAPMTAYNGKCLTFAAVDFNRQYDGTKHIPTNRKSG